MVSVKETLSPLSSLWSECFIATMERKIEEGFMLLWLFLVETINYSLASMTLKLGEMERLLDL